MTFDAVVLAGGTSRRMAALSTDKITLDVGGTSLLERAIEAVKDAHTIVVVGPQRPTQRRVHWTTETPPGSGPASALIAGIAAVTQAVVVVLAADLPFAATAVPRLLTALQGADAAMLVDATGRRQPLLAAYQTQALRALGHEWANRSVRDLVAPLHAREVPAANEEALDCDTPADVQRARALDM